MDAIDTEKTAEASAFSLVLGATVSGAALREVLPELRSRLCTTQTFFDIRKVVPRWC